MFGRKQKDELGTLIIITDALLALLDKKGYVTTSELQDEIVLRSENDIEVIGGIEYKMERE